MRKVKSSEGPGSGFGANWVPAFGKLKKSASSASGLHAQGAPQVDVWDELEVEIDLEPNMAPKALPFEHPPTSPRELVTASRGARRGNAVRAVYTLIGAEGAPRDRQPPKAAGLAKDSHIASTRSRPQLDSIDETRGTAEGRSEPDLRKSTEISPKELCKALALAVPWNDGAFRPSEYVSPRPESRGSLGLETAAKPSPGAAAKKPDQREDRERAATKINLEMREMPRSLRRALMMSEPVSDHFSDATTEDWAASDEGEGDWGACQVASISDSDSFAGGTRTVLVHGGANKYWSDFCEELDSPRGNRSKEEEGSSDFAFPQAFAIPQTRSGGYPAEHGPREGRRVDSPPFYGEECACSAEPSAGLAGKVPGAQGGKHAAGSYVQEGRLHKPTGRQGDDRVDVMDLFLPMRDEHYVQEGGGGQGALRGPSPAGGVLAEPGSCGSDSEGIEEHSTSQRTGEAGSGESRGYLNLNYFPNAGRGSNEVDGWRESFDSDEGPLVDTAFEGPHRGKGANGGKGSVEAWGNKGAGYMYDTAHAITVSGDGGQQQAAWVWDGGKGDSVEVLQTRSSRASPIPSVGYSRGLHTSHGVAFPPELDRVSGKVKGGCFDPSLIIGAIFRKLTGRSGRKESPWTDSALPKQLTLTGESMGDDDPRRRQTQRYMKRQTGILKVVEERLQAADSGRRPSHRPHSDAHTRSRIDRSGARYLESVA